jgi:group II intron reverse transcriptase/maturase
MAFTTLAHHIDVEFLREAFRLTRKDGAVGVDGQTAREYAANLEGNLRSLLDRFKSGTYQAPPVRRAHIPKGDGSSTRPIGIPTFEDKILQRAVAMLLEAVYEQDFLGCSFGFRPNRSAHQALESLWRYTTKMDVDGFVVDVDIKSFFDTLSHAHLRSFLDRRVRDGVLRRTIDKWLNAGVLEAGEIRHPELGTPQGGVISPLLSNIYLHEVIDRWFVEDVVPRLQGGAFLVRYADDLVIGCNHESDARRVHEALRLRLGRFDLTLHPEKTRLVRFGRPRYEPGERNEDDDPKPGTFDFLGFTHFWGCSRKGGWTVRRKTARSRFSRALRKIAEWCREHRHWPIEEQHKALGRKLMGHDAYYGISGNVDALARLRFHVLRIWRKWLDKRSNSSRMQWERFWRLCKRYPLPRARIVHRVDGRPAASPCS